MYVVICKLEAFKIIDVLKDCMLLSIFRNLYPLNPYRVNVGYNIIFQAQSLILFAFQKIHLEFKDR